MTKHHTPESQVDASAATCESLAKAFGGLQKNLEIPEAAREFVKRSAAAAKDRSTDLQAGANKVTVAIEDALVSAVNGMADVNRNIVDAAYRDAEATFATIDKLADVTSLTEAYQVYVDYLRRQSEVGDISDQVITVRYAIFFGPYRGASCRILPRALGTNPSAFSIAMTPGPKPRGM